MLSKRTCSSVLQIDAEKNYFTEISNIFAFYIWVKILKVIPDNILNCVFSNIYNVQLENN